MTMKRNRTAWLAIGGLAVGLLTAPRETVAQDPDLSAPASRPPAAAPAPETRSGRPVTLRLQDTPLRTALQMLFEGSGLQHAVEPGVPNVPITLDIRDVPFDTALRMLMRLAGATYRKESNIYVIGLRQPPQELVQNSYEPPAPVEAAAAAGGQRWEKIPLKYIHPLVLAAVLGGQVIPTEDQVTPGIGSLGGYGGGLGGLNGNGGYGSLNGGGLGNNGFGNYGNGNLNGFTPGAGVNGGLNGGYGPQGVGSGSNLIYPQGNSAIVGPRTRRF
jgi:hypothetical protein